MTKTSNRVEKYHNSLAADQKENLFLLWPKHQIEWRNIIIHWQQIRRRICFSYEQNIKHILKLLIPSLMTVNRKLTWILEQKFNYFGGDKKYYENSTNWLHAKNSKNLYTTGIWLKYVWCQLMSALYNLFRDESG